MADHTPDLAVPTTGHLLTVTKGPDWFEENGEVIQTDWRGEVTCLATGGCGGWWECREPHAVDGKAADAGPWDAEDSDPWQGWDEFEFHGTLHTWHPGAGWTVPYEGCVVQTVDTICDDAYEIGQQHGEGTYVVDAEWGDPGECQLLFTGRTSPAEMTPQEI